MRIRKYTLNFVRLGRPVNNQYSIYLRYFYTLNQRKYSYNINCETVLSIEQLELLKKEELTDTIQLPLLKKKKAISNLISALYVQLNEYPDKEVLKENLTLKSKHYEIESLIEQFLKTFKYEAKGISLIKYRERLVHLKNYIKLNPKYFQSMDDLVSERTIKNLEKYLDGLALVNKKPISNSTFRNTISLSVRFLNYLAKKCNLPELIYKVKVPLLSEKIHISQSEFDGMIKYDVQESGLRKDHKENLQQTQDIVYINSFIGLRINELLNLKKSNLSLNDKYITIKFFEQKKNDIREIIIVDAKAIKLVTQHLNLSKTDCIFSLYVNVFNNNLKALARLSGMTETVEYIKNYRTNTVTLKKPKWELISSHAIRRYAVNQNVVKHGIDIARQFSGHKDYATIKKNYMRNINQQELLERLKDAK